MPGDGWIAVDLDGTLAYDDEWQGIEHIGDPVPEMMKRVHEWLDSGITVKIFTARAAQPESIPHIKEWLKKHGLPDLEVTNCKDMNMIELWDDRAIQVETDTGKPISEAVQPTSFQLMNMIRKENDQ
jgi:hypothetical protein